MGDASRASLSSMVEVRAIDGQGRGCFAKSGCVIQAGTALLEGCRPIVWAPNDGREDSNCRSVKGQVSPFPSTYDAARRKESLLEIWRSRVETGGGFALPRVCAVDVFFCTQKGHHSRDIIIIQSTVVSQTIAAQKPSSLSTNQRLRTEN